MQYKKKSFQGGLKLYEVRVKEMKLASLRYKF